LESAYGAINGFGGLGFAEVGKSISGGGGVLEIHYLEVTL